MLELNLVFRWGNLIWGSEWGGGVFSGGLKCGFWVFCGIFEVVNGVGVFYVVC